MTNTQRLSVAVAIPGQCHHVSADEGKMAGDAHGLCLSLLII